jgi:predicted phage terminase large subunit-like protein
VHQSLAARIHKNLPISSAESYAISSPNTLIRFGYELNADSRAAGRFETTTGGEFYASGVGGTITGRRGSLILIDDPITSREDVEREGARNRLWDWYQSDLVTRLKPGGKICLVQTRWHVDDLAGRLLQSQPDAWTILKLPAIAEEDDPLGRAVGDWLWDDDPAYAYGQWLRERYAECEQNGAMRDWDALFMQTPVNRAGNLFLVDNLRIVDQCEDLGSTRPVRAWDLAGTTKKSSDWSVGVRMHRLPSNRLFISDVVRLKGTPEMVEKAILATARSDGWHTKISLSRDPGQAGLAQEAYLVRQLMGFEVISESESGDKVLRASPFASQVNVGNVSLLNTGSWDIRAFVEELRDFPSGKHDDIVDSCSKAFATLGGSSLNAAMWEALAGGGPAPSPGTLEYALTRIVDGPPNEPPARPPSAQPKPTAAPYVPTGQLNRFGTM